MNAARGSVLGHHLNQSSASHNARMIFVKKKPSAINMKTNNTPIQKGKLRLSFIVISLFLSVLVVFKTSITIYMKWKKKDCKKNKQTKKKICDGFCILFCLGSSQLFRLKYNLHWGKD